MEKEAVNNKYSKLFEERKQFKGYTDLVTYLGEKKHKSQSNSQKAQLREWDRYFKKESIAGTKNGILISEVYEFPLPLDIKRSIYANDIRAVVLFWLCNSLNNEIIFTNNKKLQMTGMVNENYSKIESGDYKVRSPFLKENNISRITLEDFFEKNKSNFKSRLNVVFNNLVNSGLIYTPNIVYGVKEVNNDCHVYMREESIEYNIISDSIQYILQKEFNSTDYNYIQMNKSRKSKFDRYVVKEINQRLSKINKPTIEFYYTATQIKAINKNTLYNACKIDNVKETLISLNRKVAHNIINDAEIENVKEINRTHAKKLNEIRSLRERDYDAWQDLAIEIYEDTKNQYGYGKEPETEYLLTGTRGGYSYVEEIAKLTRLLIIQSIYEINRNFSLN